MKTSPISPCVRAALAWCVLPFQAGALGLQEPAPGQSPAPAPAPLVQGGLRRVDPRPENEDGGELKDLFARDFDRARWQERLTQPDLDKRERSLEGLLKRARLDPVSRAFLEELAADPQGGELAWTARLALRELGRANFSMQGMPPGADPFGSAQRMQQWMEELFARDGFALMLQPHPTLGLTHGSGRSVQVEQSAQGALVRITETVDGQERTREYPGKSLQEILDQNPELQGELDGLDIRVQAGAPLQLRFDLDRRGQGGGLQPLRRFPGERQDGLRLAPQGKSRPIVTDRLGVIVNPVGAARAQELGLVDQGLLVERSFPETFAHLLGVGTGDVLIELNKTALRTAADIERVMSARGADDELTLVWLDELGQRQEKTWKAGGR